MIIQYPDGHYEICPLQPAYVRWFRRLQERTQTIVTPQQCAADCCEIELMSNLEQCLPANSVCC